MTIISPRAEQYFKAVSYGKLDVTLAADQRWIRMRKPSSDYHFGRDASFEYHRAYFQEAIDLAGPRPPRQLWHTYVGEFSAMGNPAGRAPEYLGWERWQLGWLDDAQVSCTDAASTTLTLTPLERVGGVKLALVPTGPNTALAVESRRAEGFDGKLPRAGLLVYTVDTRLSSHDGAVRVQPPGDSDEQHVQALLAVGQTVTAGELTVTLLASAAHGDAVRIERAPSHRD